MLDFTSDFGAKALARLKNEEGIWLTTVNADGTPQPNPVWFLWDADAETVLIYTMPASHKVRNLKRSPKVSLHFDAKLHYEDLVVLTGEVEMDGEVSPELKDAYIEKYREDIARLDMTPESFFQSYSTVLQIKPTRLRGW